MNDLELLSMIFERSERAWGLIEFWVSVSFATIAAVHYSRSRINGLLAVTILILYTSFSMMALVSFGAHNNLISAAFESLAELEQQGQLSKMGSESLDYSRNSNRQPIYAFTLLSTYLGTVGYVGFSYLSRRKERDA